MFPICGNGYIKNMEKLNHIQKEFQILNGL